MAELKGANVEKLKELVEWYEKGLLSATEFATAKQQLGLQAVL